VGYAYDARLEILGTEGLIMIGEVRGVIEGNGRVTRCDMVRITGWDRLIEYLGEVWDEMWA
jgi:hypothetical protein